MIFDLLLRRSENIVFMLLKTFCLKFVREYEDVLVLRGTCVPVNKAPCQLHLYNRRNIQGDLPEFLLSVTVMSYLIPISDQYNWFLRFLSLFMTEF